MTTVTIKGNVGGDPTHDISEAGVEWARFRVADTERRKQQDGTWQDVSTTWYTVSCFNDLARNVALAVKKGDPVIVVGRLRMEEYTREPGGIPTASACIAADTVGHDLRKGSGKFTHKRQGQESDGESRPGNVDENGVIAGGYKAPPAPPGPASFGASQGDQDEGPEGEGSEDFTS